MLKDYDLKKLVLPLKEWYLENARDLRWRETPDPYYVWVSEIMLQQTRVEAVKDYFDRFVEVLPDVGALAECPEDVYLKLWEGLGYYNRVRNMHTAAVQIMEAYDGIIPDDPEVLLRLKGIGSYTAGAIASLAYGKPVAAVDGNVFRVLTRVSGDDSDIGKPAFRKLAEERIGRLLEDVTPELTSPQIFNQGLMELGALVCVPNGPPHCDSCPWEPFCMARKENLTGLLPVKQKPKARKIENRTVLLLEENRRIAIRKRPSKGLLAGLYEFPNYPAHFRTSEALAFVRKLGYEPIRINRLADSVHIFSHVEWHMIAYRILIEEAEFSTDEQNAHREAEQLFFVDADEQKRKYALPSAFAAYKAYDTQDIG